MNLEQLPKLDRRQHMISLRSAGEEDAELLFAWRNDPLTRAASRNTDELSYQDHLAWLKSSLVLATRRIYIAEFDNVAIGTVRADTGIGETELSWTIAPEMRGKGFAKPMVEAALGTIQGPVRAEIRSDNKASRRVAESAGFRCDCEIDGIQHFYCNGRFSQDEPATLK
jgi:RimJ/RimL family protein N-acetyltransferase